jgi:hypothetical protein
MSRSSKRPVWALAVLGLTALAGCSDLYYDRRETIAFGGADAVATNTAVQTIDPWPPKSADRHHTTDGAIVAGAMQRYRTGRVIKPRGAGTSSSGYAAPEAAPETPVLPPPPMSAPMSIK